MGAIVIEATEKLKNTILEEDVSVVDTLKI